MMCVGDVATVVLNRAPAITHVHPAAARLTMARVLKRAPAMDPPHGHVPACPCGGRETCGIRHRFGQETRPATSPTRASETDLVVLDCTPRRFVAVDERSFGRLCSAFRTAACHFPGKSWKLLASNRASWNSRR